MTTRKAIIQLIAYVVPTAATWGAYVVMRRRLDVSLLVSSTDTQVTSFIGFETIVFHLKTRALVDRRDVCERTMCLAKICTVLFLPYFSVWTLVSVVDPLVESQEVRALRVTVGLL